METQKFFKTCSHNVNLIEAREYVFSDGQFIVMLLCPDCTKSDIFNAVPHRVIEAEVALNILRGYQ